MKIESIFEIDGKVPFHVDLSESIDGFAHSIRVTVPVSLSDSRSSMQSEAYKLAIPALERAIQELRSQIDAS